MKLPDWKDVKVLVTGASGFKGSWLCAALVELGARVYGTTTGQKQPVSVYGILELNKHLTEITVDTTDRQQAYDLLNYVEPDVIFHLAAVAVVPVSLRDPRRTFEVNVMGTLNILEGCRSLKLCRKLIVCSTDHVFGDIPEENIPEGGFTETSPVSYSGPYDTSKAAMELLMRSYHRTYHSELPAICITRSANVIGYGDENQRRVVPLFVKSSLDHNCILLRYKKNGRQFIHATDLVEGYIRAADKMDVDYVAKDKNKTYPEVEEVVTPTYHFALESYENTQAPYIRMESLANLVAAILGSKVDSAESISYAPQENRVLALNCAETRSTLGWYPRRSLREAIVQLGEWYRTGSSNRDRLKKLIQQDIAQIIDGLNT